MAEQKSNLGKLPYILAASAIAVAGWMGVRNSAVNVDVDAKSKDGVSVHIKSSASQSIFSSKAESEFTHFKAVTELQRNFAQVSIADVAKDSCAYAKSDISEMLLMEMQAKDEVTVFPQVRTSANITTSKVSIPDSVQKNVGEICRTTSAKGLAFTQDHICIAFEAAADTSNRNSRDSYNLARIHTEGIEGAIEMNSMKSLVEKSCAEFGGDPAKMLQAKFGIRDISINFGYPVTVGYSYPGIK
jgi:hypothetical protein